MNLKSGIISLTLAVSLSLGAVGCSTSGPVKAQAYARLPDHRSFEYEFPVVWKGIEQALSGTKIAERDPSEVGVLEMKKLTSRKLETEWAYSQSRDKYLEYQVNGSPRKKFLQIRYKYRIGAEAKLGSTLVTVRMSEEIEKLGTDGTPKGYSNSDNPDTSRVSEVLDRINQAILAAPNL